MVRLVIRIGILGFSEGNGHPYSFSAIINGFDETAFKQAGWPVILDYLSRRSSSEFSIDDAMVTHVWTQDLDLSKKIAAACRIENICADVSEMFGEVDAVIVARDDWETHEALAAPFLHESIPVFVDKPLTLDNCQLDRFMPHISEGKLMSCSGLRYAVELDRLRRSDSEVAGISSIRCTVVNGLEKYGVHLIEAVASLGGPFARPVSIRRLDVPHDAFLFILENGVPFHLDCLGSVEKIFCLNIADSGGDTRYDLHDNFRAFKRTLRNYVDMVKSGVPPIDPMETNRIMRLLVAARSLAHGDEIRFYP